MLQFSLTVTCKKRDNLWQSAHLLFTYTHTHTWFMGADIALWVGWGQRGCDKQMFSWIGILGQVGLVKERERERDEIVSQAACTRREECLLFCTCEFSCQHLQTLHDKQPSDYSVGGGNGRDNVACHG